MIETVIPTTFATPKGQSLAKKEWMHKGTTTLAFVFQGGIIVAVDSRASMGSIISSQTVKKIIEINEYMLGTMAGCAADCSYWERHLSKLCRLHQVKHGERVSIVAASKMLANIMYYFRGYGLSMGTMLAGWDHTGPKLCCIMDDGSRVVGNLFSVGSGSLFAYGVIDDGYKFDLTVDEAVELGKRGIYQATLRDGGSGGCVTVYHVHQNGWTKVVDRQDVSELHRFYAKEKGEDAAKV